MKCGPTRRGWTGLLILMLQASPDAAIEAPQPGGSSGNQRILGVRAGEDRLFARIEGRCGRSYQLRLWTDLKVTAVRGGTLAQGRPQTMTVRIPEGPGNRFAGVDVELQVQK